MSSDLSKRIFDNTSIYAKKRYYVSEQDKAVDWNEIKAKHDTLLEDVQKGRVLEIPQHAIVYKLNPTRMEFYYAYDNFIADRVLFTLEGKLFNWNYFNSLICILTALKRNKI